MPTLNTAADIDPDFTRDPITGDVMGSSRAAAAKRSFIDIVRTRFGERPWAAEIGTPELLFNNGDAARSLVFQQTLDEIAEKYAEDIVLESVNFSDHSGNAVTINIEFSLRGRSQDSFSFEVDL